MKKVQDPEQAHIALAKEAASVLREHAAKLQEAGFHDGCADYCFNLVRGSFGRASDEPFISKMHIERFINLLAGSPELAASLQKGMGDVGYEGLLEVLVRCNYMFSDLLSEHVQLLFTAMHMEGWYTEYSDGELREAIIESRLKMQGIVSRADIKALVQRELKKVA